MVANQKPTGRAMSMPAGLTLGAAVSLALTMIVSAIIAMLAEKEIIPESSIGYGVIVLLLTASAAGAFTANGKIRRRKLLVSLLSGVIYYAILLGITALFFGGQFQGMGVTALLVLAGAALPILLNQQGRGAVKHKRRKMPYR